MKSQISNPEPRPSFALRLAAVALGLLLLAAGLWVWKRPRPDHPSPVPSPHDVTNHGRPARPAPPPPSGTPAASGSHEIAKLIGNKSMGDREVIAGLRKIVDDAGRPPAERMEALDHTLNLIPTDQPEWLKDLAARRVMPDEQRARLVADALNRPRKLQGETLVLLMENAGGDLRSEILDELHGLLGQDLGNDPAAWRRAVESLPE